MRGAESAPSRPWKPHRAFSTDGPVEGRGGLGKTMHSPGESSEVIAATGELVGAYAPAAAGATSNMELLQMQTHLTTPGGGGNPLTMSSREIAEVCEARHNDVVATIERLFEKGVLRESRKTTRAYSPPAGGRPTEVYDLTKRDSLVVVSGYDDVIRAKLIDRWIEVENSLAWGPPALPNFADPVAAARAWADEREARVIADRTKAEIGSRREATAMNTASQATKRAKALAIELDETRIRLDENGQYATVKRMEKHYGQDFPWLPLRRVSKARNLPIKKIGDVNYDQVNAYHADAWQAVYGVAIPNGELH